MYYRVMINNLKESFQYHTVMTHRLTRRSCRFWSFSLNELNLSFSIFIVDSDGSNNIKILY